MNNWTSKTFIKKQRTIHTKFSFTPVIKNQRKIEKCFLSYKSSSTLLAFEPANTLNNINFIDTFSSAFDN